MRFLFDFENTGPDDEFVYQTEEGQQADIEIEGDTAVMYVNQPACIFLAKLFAQLGHARVRPGFHIHLGKDFDSEAPERLRVVIHEPEAPK